MLPKAFTPAVEVFADGPGQPTDSTPDSLVCQATQCRRQLDQCQ